MQCHFPSCWKTYFVGITKSDIERDNAEARIIEGWEQLVKTTASKVIGKI